MNRVPPCTCWRFFSNGNWTNRCMRMRTSKPDGGSSERGMTDGGRTASPELANEMADVCEQVWKEHLNRVILELRDGPE